MKSKILIVDDSEFNRSLLSDMLSDDYEILEAENGIEAMAILGQQRLEISLVLLDIVMPEMDGLEVLAAMEKGGWIEKTPVIIISSESSSTFVDMAYNLDATEYISRPFDEKTVKRRVKNTIMLYAKQKQLEDMVSSQIFEKEKNNSMMIEILSHLLEFRNGESGQHVINIRSMTKALLQQLVSKTNRYPLSPSKIELITNASALHDIGKISIPESILNKPGKLTPEEYEIMKGHSAIGAQVLERVGYSEEELVKTAHDICLYHHERYDGKGYPTGLRGDDIPISAQVVALADVYDALTHNRVYKPAFSHEKAMQMILDGECGAFNPILLDCLKEIGPQVQQSINQSANRLPMTELQGLTDSILKIGGVSNRTLALLEQERTKYRFFASLSKELQFEYNPTSDIFSISEWGAQQLGINEIIAHPSQFNRFSEIFLDISADEIKDKLLTATQNNPVISQSCRIMIDGKPRQYKLLARPLWADEESNEIIGVIGKFIDTKEDGPQLNCLNLIRHDNLTGLSNRAYAEKSICECLSKLKDSDKSYALMLFDLDNFKTANRQYGKIFGDHVLQTVAQRIRACVRGADIVARLGEDDFLVFVEFKGQIEPLADRIFSSINCTYQDFSVSAGMGIAVAPDDGDNLDTLFKNASAALHTAKQDGSNVYRIYDGKSNALTSAEPVSVN